MDSASFGLESGGPPLVVVATPTPACDPTEPPRSSTRLLNQTKDSALCRAMRRKARLLEGEMISAGKSVREWTSKKVKAKSLLCDVKLSDAEAKDLQKLMCANA